MTIRHSIARICNHNGTHWGTAFFIGSGNLLLTCFHVAQDTRDSDGMVVVEIVAPEIRGVALQPIRLSARILVDDCSAADVWDVALLELIEPAPEWIKPLEIASSIDAYRGQQIHSYGFCDARNLYGDPAVGTVIGLATDPLSSRQVIEIMSQQLTSGFSGAPIVDDEHQVVIGMMMSTLRQDAKMRFENHCWAVPATAFPDISARIPLIAHPLISELLRLASVRYPSLLDYAVSTPPLLAMMPIRVRQNPANENRSQLDAQQMLEMIANASCKVAILRGVSGSGKSTYLRTILCRDLADRYLTPGQEGRVPLYFKATALVTGAAGTLVEQLSQVLAADKSIRYKQDQLIPDLIRLIETSRIRFAVMIDALDEINDPVLRAETAQYLLALGQQLSAYGHWLIVASRPIEELKQFDSSDFPVLSFDMCSSTEEDTLTFFSEILADRAPTFREQFKGVPTADLQGSPLMAVLAVSLFLEQDKLPNSIIEIFSAYIELLVSKANGYAAMRAIETDVLDEWENVLERLAYQSLLVDVLTWDKAQKVLQQGLREKSTMTSRIIAKEQLNLVTESPIVLIKEGNKLHWTHLSIRDYLAGSFINKLCRSQQAWETVLGDWRDPTFKNAITFAVLSRSEERRLDHQMLYPFLQLSGTDSDFDTVSFLCSLIQLRAPIEPQLMLDIIDIAVIFGLEKINRFCSCEFVFSPLVHPFDHLLPLCQQHPAVAVRLRQIIDLPTIPTEIKRVLAKKLFDL